MIKIEATDEEKAILFKVLISNLIDNSPAKGDWLVKSSPDEEFSIDCISHKVDLLKAMLENRLMQAVYFQGSYLDCSYELLDSGKTVVIRHLKKEIDKLK